MTARAGGLLARCAPLALALLAACSSGPYWNAADRAAAERRDAAERAARGDRTAAVPSPAAAAPSHTPVEPVETHTPPPAPREIVETRNAPPPASGSIDESELDDPATSNPVPAESPGGLDSVEAEAAQAAYDAALDHLQRGDASAAEASFQEFLARFGSSELADNAQYWIAESRLRRGETEGALAGFRRVVENYPSGNKVPDSLLKIGMLLQEQGELPLAREVYDELVDRYPGSAAAESARERRNGLPPG